LIGQRDHILIVK